MAALYCMLVEYGGQGGSFVSPNEASRTNDVLCFDSFYAYWDGRYTAHEYAVNCLSSQQPLHPAFGVRLLLQLANRGCHCWSK